MVEGLNCPKKKGKANINYQNYYCTYDEDMEMEECGSADYNNLSSDDVTLIRRKGVRNGRELRRCSSIVWMIGLVSLMILQCVSAQYQQDPQQTGQGESWNTQDYFKREHSLSKPYQGQQSTLIKIIIIRKISWNR